MTGSPLASLRRIATAKPPPPPGERCEMCSEQIFNEHSHVVNIEGRQLMCVCRGCYLLFTDTNASLRFRAVPDRYLSFPEFALGRREWQLLQIPVGLAFFFRNSFLISNTSMSMSPIRASRRSSLAFSLFKSMGLLIGLLPRTRFDFGSDQLLR